MIDWDKYNRDKAARDAKKLVRAQQAAEGFGAGEKRRRLARITAAKVRRMWKPR
jgi:hypothetical protein